MSITDELRQVAAKTEEANGRCGKLYRGDLDHIADRIDEKHEDELTMERGRAITELGSDIALNYIQLPKDADGVPFRVGDHVEVPDGLPSEGKPWQAGTITRLDLGATCWHVRVIAGGMNHVYLTENVRHYHEPTVEDVLTEFAEKITDSQIPNVHPTYEEAIAEYAAKLRLAGEDA